ELQWNKETGHYNYGDINWAEFFAVIKGNGPCNKQRLNKKVKAHEAGAWVRDAGLAYAAKKQASAAGFDAKQQDKLNREAQS
ncbi:MAG: 1,2-phenylacetyl-CoA epoxidase subunit A, partial [Gammaproteobacteria bacterium]|nr:1,2-phenylacetyl-CoA epoxidase subunit A [Gammaproteobacteria bacterium]